MEDILLRAELDITAARNSAETLSRIIERANQKSIRSFRRVDRSIDELGRGLNTATDRARTFFATIQGGAAQALRSINALNAAMAATASRGAAVRGAAIGGAAVRGGAVPAAATAGAVSAATPVVVPRGVVSGAAGFGSAELALGASAALALRGRRPRRFTFGGTAAPTVGGMSRSAAEHAFVRAGFRPLGVGGLVGSFRPGVSIPQTEARARHLGSRLEFLRVGRQNQEIRDLIVSSRSNISTLEGERQTLLRQINDLESEQRLGGPSSEGFRARARELPALRRQLETVDLARRYELATLSGATEPRRQAARMLRDARNLRQAAFVARQGGAGGPALGANVLFGRANALRAQARAIRSGTPLLAPDPFRRLDPFFRTAPEANLGGIIDRANRIRLLRLQRGLAAGAGFAHRGLAGVVGGLPDPSGIGRGIGRGFVGVGNFARGAAPLALGAGVAGGLAIREFASFETSLARIAALSEDARENIGQIGDEIRQVSRTSGQNVNELADALFKIQSAGFRGPRALQLLRAGSDIALGGFTTPDVATEGLLAVLGGGFDVAPQQVADQLQAAAQASASTLSDLASNIGQVASVANSSGVQLDDLLAALAAISNQTRSTAIATTQVRALIVAAQRAGPEFTEALGERGLVGVAEEFKRVSAETGEELIQVVGRQEALQAITNLLTNDTEGYNQALEQVKESQGLAKEAAEEASKTLENRLSVEVARFKDSIIDLGEALSGAAVPAVRALADVASDLADIANSASGRNVERVADRARSSIGGKVEAVIEGGSLRNARLLRAQLLTSREGSLERLRGSGSHAPSAVEFRRQERARLRVIEKQLEVLQGFIDREERRERRAQTVPHQPETLVVPFERTPEEINRADRLLEEQLPAPPPIGPSRSRILDLLRIGGRGPGAAPISEPGGFGFRGSEAFEDDEGERVVSAAEQATRDTIDSISQTLSSSLSDAIIDGFETGFDNAEDIARSFLRQIASAILSRLIGTIGGGGQAGFGLLGAATGTLGSGGFQFGGIVNRPTIALLGEKEPERVLREREFQIMREAAFNSGGGGGGGRHDIVIDLNSGNIVEQGVKTDTRAARLVRSTSNTVTNVTHLRRRRRRR